MMKTNSNLLSIAVLAVAFVAVADAMPSRTVRSPSPASSSSIPTPSPSPSLLCDMDSVVTTADYVLNNNLWGIEPGTIGSQCYAIDKDLGKSGVSWHATWNWQNKDDQVKSFPYAQLDTLPSNVPLSRIESLPTFYNWT